MSSSKDIVVSTYRQANVLDKLRMNISLICLVMTLFLCQLSEKTNQVSSFCLDARRRKVLFSGFWTDAGWGTKNLVRPKQSKSMVALDIEQDTRPHEQRAKGPRPARRLNHGFRYLHRQNNTQYRDMTSFEYLSKFYSPEHIEMMNTSFPPLLELNVSRHLYPKMRFLQRTMGVSNISNISIPPQYFGARLERTIAPRHAFLVYKGLPHGRELIEDPSKWEAFLISCRTSKRFCALCNQWAKERGKVSGDVDERRVKMVTAKQIEAFDALFSRGILTASRDELVQWNNTWPLDYVNISCAEIADLLIQHGANPLERDTRGVSLLHWAAGTGNLEFFKVIQPHFPNRGILEPAKRDGASPLHWAAAGANSKEFGTGGHSAMCEYLMSECDHPAVNVSRKELVNSLTFDGNSPLMWAGWSGTVETVKMMVRNLADSEIANRNGCTAAHWAASGGNLEVCKYLKDVVKVNFFEPNYGGNTPLTHAVAFGRAEIVEWLRNQAESSDDDDIAASLAQDFFHWTDGDAKRKRVLQLFMDDYWDELDDASDDSPNVNTAQALELEEY